MSHPVEELMLEHRLIERMLLELERRVIAPAGTTFPAAFVEKALDFFASFADQRHHEKEERVLFPALAAAGVLRQGGPIGVMEYEHTVGRACLQTIRTALPAAKEGSVIAIEAVREAAAAYIDLLGNHIRKEDNVLFRIAQNVLYDERQLRAIDEQFHDTANPVLSDEFLKHYQDLVEELAGVAA